MTCAVRAALFSCRVWRVSSQKGGSERNEGNETYSIVVEVVIHREDIFAEVVEIFGLEERRKQKIIDLLVMLVDMKRSFHALQWSENFSMRCTKAGHARHCCRLSPCIHDESEDIVVFHLIRQ